MSRATTLTRNIIVGSVGGAIACGGENDITHVMGNLFWLNSPVNVTYVDHDVGCYFTTPNITADPLFCNPASDDLHVAADSPAVIDGVAIGAFPAPGCGGGSLVIADRP